jgi:hypothetical protein
VQELSAFNCLVPPVFTGHVNCVFYAVLFGLKQVGTFCVVVWQRFKEKKLSAFCWLTCKLTVDGCMERTTELNVCNLCSCYFNQCRRDRWAGGEGWRGKSNYRSLVVRKGAQSPTVMHIFCISRCYYYLSIVQINPFTQSPGHSATENHSFRFRVKIFSRPAVLWAGRIFFIWVRTAVGGPDFNFGQCYLIHTSHTQISKRLLIQKLRLTWSTDPTNKSVFQNAGNARQTISDFVQWYQL